MSIFYKTLGGLKASYYIRHFIFGAVISAIFGYMTIHSSSGLTAGSIIFIIINTIFYPYARFVYEQIIGFVMGENVFFVNAIMKLATKLFTMMMCWGLSIFIAPIGLAYLYYHHTKIEKKVKC